MEDLAVRVLRDSDDIMGTAFDARAAGDGIREEYVAGACNAVLLEFLQRGLGAGRVEDRAEGQVAWELPVADSGRFDGVQADADAAAVHAYFADQARFGDHFDGWARGGLYGEGDEVGGLLGLPVPVLG